MFRTSPILGSIRHDGAFPTGPRSDQTKDAPRHCATFPGRAAPAEIRARKGKLTARPAPLGIHRRTRMSLEQG